MVPCLFFPHRRRLLDLIEETIDSVFHPRGLRGVIFDALDDSDPLKHSTPIKLAEPGDWDGAFRLLQECFVRGGYRISKKTCNPGKHDSVHDRWFQCVNGGERRGRSGKTRNRLSQRVRLLPDIELKKYNTAILSDLPQNKLLYSPDYYAWFMCRLGAG